MSTRLRWPRTFDAGQILHRPPGAGPQDETTSTLADRLHLNGERPTGAADLHPSVRALLRLDRMPAAASCGVLHRPMPMPLRAVGAMSRPLRNSRTSNASRMVVVANLRATPLGERVTLSSPAPAKSRLVVLLSRLALIISGAGVLAAAFLPVSSAPSLGSDWLSHGAAFLVLAALSAAALPGTSLWRLWWSLTLFGVLIEVIQGLPGVNRGPSVLEAVWDSGVVAAVFLVISIGTVRHEASGSCRR